MDTIVKGPKRFGMTGYERYLLYRFAAKTGLRAREIRTLIVGSFDLYKLSVTVKAGYSKHRREDVLPLRSDTAILLGEYFKGKTPNVKAFGGACKQLTKRTSDMIKTDFESLLLCSVSTDAKPSVPASKLSISEELF